MRNIGKIRGKDIFLLIFVYLDVFDGIVWVDFKVNYLVVIMFVDVKFYLVIFREKLSIFK